MSTTRIALAALFLPALLAAQHSQEPATRRTPGPAKAHAKTVVSKSYYPDNLCLVKGRPIKGKGVTLERDGRRLRFCCKKCAKAFAKDPKPWLAKLDAKIIKDQAAAYPLKTCPVSDEKLDEMGDPHDVVIGGRLVRLCCEDCEADARKHASETLAKVRAALVGAKGDGAATCPISGKKVEAGKGVNLVYGNRVIRLCCKGCIKKFDKAPAKYLAKGRAAGHPASRKSGN